jgi:hypothetical protein
VLIHDQADRDAICKLYGWPQTFGQFAISIPATGTAHGEVASERAEA